MARAVTSNTIALFASALSWPHGSIDDFTALGKVAKKWDIGLHVDSCLGGFVLPFCKDAGYDLGEEFDFRVEGVTSISADVHKYVRFRFSVSPNPTANLSRSHIQIRPRTQRKFRSPLRAPIHPEISILHACRLRRRPLRFTQLYRNSTGDVDRGLLGHYAESWLGRVCGSDRRDNSDCEVDQGESVSVRRCRETCRQVWLIGVPLKPATHAGSWMVCDGRRESTRDRVRGDQGQPPGCFGRSWEERLAPCRTPSSKR